MARPGRDYRRCVDHWNGVFGAEEPRPPRDKGTGNAVLDRGLDWLCAEGGRVLDFGCGNGVLLLLCALRGGTELAGIDLSPAAVANARTWMEAARCSPFTLLEGGVEALGRWEAGSFDALIFSNILDNLYPEDALEALAQAGRLLRPGGRALIKLNPWLSPEQIRDWGIRVVEGNLLDDGLLLWNNTTQRWRELIGAALDIVGFETVYYPEFDQTNRLFLAKKKIRITKGKRGTPRAYDFVRCFLWLGNAACGRGRWGWLCWRPWPGC